MPFALLPKVPQEVLAEVQVIPDDWSEVFLGRPERQARGPRGQTATVADTVVAIRRLAPERAR